MGYWTTVVLMKFIILKVFNVFLKNSKIVLYKTVLECLYFKMIFAKILLKYSIYF